MTGGMRWVYGCSGTCLQSYSTQDRVDHSHEFKCVCVAVGVGVNQKPKAPYKTGNMLNIRGRSKIMRLPWWYKCLYQHRKLLFFS